MTSKDYKPSMKPILRPAGEIRRPGKESIPYPAQIIVSMPLWLEISLDYSDQQREELRVALCGTTLCPAQYYFLDTPRVRELLGVAAALPTEPAGGSN